MWQDIGDLHCVNNIMYRPTLCHFYHSLEVCNCASDSPSIVLFSSFFFVLCLGSFARVLIVESGLVYLISVLYYEILAYPIHQSQSYQNFFM